MAMRSRCLSLSMSRNATERNITQRNALNTSMAMRSRRLSLYMKRNATERNTGQRNALNITVWRGEADVSLSLYLFLCDSVFGVSAAICV